MHWLTVEVFDGDRPAAGPSAAFALDAVPDPVSGVLVYPHRGGGTGKRQPRRPLPQVAGGSAALPLPDEKGVMPATAHFQGHPSA